MLNGGHADMVHEDRSAPEMTIVHRLDRRGPLRRATDALLIVFAFAIVTAVLFDLIPIGPATHIASR